MDTNYSELETHIFFDDGFESVYGEGDTGKLVINPFVKQLVNLIKNGVTSAYKDWPGLSVNTTNNMYSTPYGGRLVWTLPGKTKLTIHLKDKCRIRQTKRWSQVYYEKSQTCDFSLTLKFIDGKYLNAVNNCSKVMYIFYILGYKMSSLPVSSNRKETIASNAFILTVDGDTGFKPEAVHSLVSALKRNDKIGAVCGRIHPKGSGSN